MFVKTQLYHHSASASHLDTLCISTTGLNIVSVSLVGEEAKLHPDQPNNRIDFVFDEVMFQIKDGQS